ncbi:MAG: YaiI/YqxD family protein [Fusobacteriota bacterium]
MRIIIDADGCPKNVREICEDISKNYKLDLIMVVDVNHELEAENAKVITVDQGNDSVDFKIKNITQKEDIVITQDYGLASIVIKNSHAVLNPKGFKYTKINIESLMFQRYINRKAREAGNKISGPKKRKNSDDLKFRELLLNEIN